MRFLPRVHRRVFGSWLCLIFLLSLVFEETGDASPTTAIIPFLASIPLLVSYGTTVFLIPDLVLSSSTPPPAPRPHPTPIAASHDFSPPHGRWIVSYHTTFDDKTLYNIAIRRPLNGTAKLITRKLVNWIGPDEFVGAPATGENDAALESQVFSTPMSLGLIGFPGLELGTRLEELHRLGTHFDNGRSVLPSLFDFKRQESRLTELFKHRAHTDTAFYPDSDAIAIAFGPSQLAHIPPFTKSLQLVVEPSRSETPTRTWKEALERYGFVTILALVVAAFLIFLAADAIETLIAKAFDKCAGAVLKTRLGVSEFRKGLCRRIAGLTTRCLIATGFIEPEFVPERLLTPMSSPRKAERWQLSPKQPRSGSILLRIPCSPQKKLAPKGSETGLPLEEIIKALNERLAWRDKKPVGPPFLSPAWAKLHRPGKIHTLTKSGSSSLRKIELLPSEPRHISSPLSKEEEKHQLWNGDGSINPLWIPLPPATDMEWDFLEGNTLTVTEEDQVEQGVALEVQAVPLNVSTDAAPNRPVVPPPLHPLASSLTTSETTAEVLDNPDSTPIDEKTEKEDSPALNPSAPNSSGIVPSAQVSGPMPEGGSLGAHKLDSSSSVPLATIERLRAILCMDIPSTSQPSKPHDSGAAPSAQVSGSAPKTGFLGKRLEVEATVPSAKHSRKTVQANIDRIENANRRGKSSVRKRGATVARLDTIAEDVSDSTVSSDAPTVIVEASSSSIPPPATTNAGAIQPPADADEPSNSGADSSAQVSGTVPKTVFLAKLGSPRLEVEAGVASARQSRMVIQANIDRIKKGNGRQRSSGRRKGAALARREASSLDSIAEDLEDSTVSSTAVTATSSSSSIPTPVTTNTAAELPTNAHARDADDHLLREAPAAEDTVEEKPNKVVTFLNQVQVLYLPMSRWDREARRKFCSEAKEREIEEEYRVWAKGKQPAEGYRRLTASAMKGVGGSPRSFFDDDDDDDLDEEGFSKSDQKKAKVESKRSGESVFYGASTSRDGGRSLSEDEWNRLEKYQAVRSNPAAKEVVRPQLETAPMDVNVDAVFKFTFTLPVELPPPSLPSPVRTTPVPMPGRIRARINARPSATSIQMARRRAAFRP
ncbi:hypothetical protein FRC04_008169 [Tulasnella sp. 424]|nr:hypothetical protein FRC04_008169 [Tulasnella sp. 424]KAG8974453.1 hypothetical protein FRC05_007252 [Tulasnella sp. 425]